MSTRKCSDKMHTDADKKTIFRKDNQVREQMGNAALWKD